MGRPLDRDSGGRGHRKIHGSEAPASAGKLRQLANQGRESTMNRGQTGVTRGVRGRTGRGPQR